jgi:hypothetical protein
VSTATAGLWTPTEWDNFTATVREKSIVIPKQLIKLTYLMNPVLFLQPEYSTRSVPPSYFVYWMPTKSVAEMTALVQSIYSNTIGRIHAQKIGLKLESLHLAVSPRMIYPDHNDEWLFWYNQTDLAYWNGGIAVGDMAILEPTGDILGGNIADRRYYWIRAPWILHSLLPWMMPYDANNIVGCGHFWNPTGPALFTAFEGVTGADGDLAIYGWKYSITSAESITDHIIFIPATALEVLASLFACLMSKSTCTIVGALADALDESRSYVWNATARSNTTNAAVWDSLFINMMIKFADLGEPKLGIPVLSKVNDPKGTTQRGRSRKGKSKSKRGGYKNANSKSKNYRSSKRKKTTR